MPHGGDIYRNKVNIDMSVNLNPHRIPYRICSALESGIKASISYPDPDQQSVREALASIDDLDSTYCLAGNGASELIMVVTAALDPQKAAVVCPAFSGYKRALCGQGVNSLISICLSSDNGFDFTDEVINRIPDDTELICIADPVSHTGKKIDAAVLEKILEYSDEHGISVILDESFFFLADSVSGAHKRDTAAYVKRYAGLYIIRSFTKLFALPGIRMGYLITQPQNMEAVKTRLPEWNLSMPAQYCMPECASVIMDGSFVSESVKLISAQRRILMQGIAQAGFYVYDSDTVYICFKADPGLYGYMLGKGILIRDLKNEEGLGEGYFRIAVKNAAENAEFLRRLYEYDQQPVKERR